MSELLFLEPIFKETIWGGHKLKKVYGEQCPAGTIGECWMISAHKNGMGVVSGGIYQGKTLEEMWNQHPELFENESGKWGTQFPLLVKFIDAEKDLSIQVHPSDEYAWSHEKSLGKMECWYVLDCKEDATIIIGHHAKDKKEVKEMIEKKQWSQFLREVPIKKGDFFQIDPGCVHAIKGGTVILETQQSSDVTYRVYDYDRKQDGKRRKLHLKESMMVIEAPYMFHKIDRCCLETENVRIEHLVNCSKYVVEKYEIHGKWKHDFKVPFANLTVIEGKGYFDGNQVVKGQSFIVPSNYGPCMMEGEFTLICSWPVLPEKAQYQEQKGYRIEITDWMGRVKERVEDEEQGILAFQGIYEEGDKIQFKVPKKNEFYQIRIDDTMDEAMVYLTKDQVCFEIPFHEKKKSYNKKAFTGDRHYLTIRRAEPYEIGIYKNLAKNVMDQHGENECYPHASANVETRGESVFAARNAIDGVLANRSHGSWPYESWGINKNDNAEMLLEFGRRVDFNRIVLYTRADFPHDNWWTNATFSFSDGTEETVEMEKSSKPHVFHIEKKAVTWVKLSRLKKADDPSPFPALTQIEIYGTESK